VRIIKRPLPKTLIYNLQEISIGHATYC